MRHDDKHRQTAAGRRRCVQLTAARLPTTGCSWSRERDIKIRGRLRSRLLGGRSADEERCGRECCESCARSLRAAVLATPSKCARCHPWAACSPRRTAGRPPSAGLMRRDQPARRRPLPRGEQIVNDSDHHGVPSCGRQAWVHRNQGVRLQSGDREILGLPERVPVVLTCDLPSGAA